MLALQQNCRMDLPRRGWFRRLGAGRGWLLKKRLWQGIVVGMVLACPSTQPGLWPPTETSSYQSLQSVKFLSPEAGLPLALEDGFPAARQIFDEGSALWVAARPQSALPPPKPVDRVWEGPLVPTEAALLADAEDGHLDQHSLLRAALIAGGTLQEDRLLQYETKFQAWVGQLQKQNIAAQEPIQRAETIFRFLHQQILTGGYDLRASDLANTFQTGKYNCVSASLLYHCLLEPFGIEAFGLEMPGHARTRLRIGDRVLDVETTCARWFELLRNPEKPLPEAAPGPTVVSQWRAKGVPRPSVENQATVHQRADSASSSQAVSASATPASVRQINNLALTATIYYNRGVDLLSEGRFAEALAANAKALRLDPSHPTAWGNFLATLNNWAVFLGRSGQYAEAAELLRQGLVLAPTYEPFQANFIHVHQQWTAALRREGRFAEAWQILARSAAVVPASYNAAFRRFQLELAKDWTRVYLSRGAESQAVDLWQEVRRRLGAGSDVLEAEQAALAELARRRTSPAPHPIQEVERAAVSATVLPETP
ncbi:MAG TPA: tetratricopeptide repeat protein [Thermoguttaceae bacterium]|nr:tetratricopeptide repeat protein [Thermoguttaceae bacterium]